MTPGLDEYDAICLTLEANGGRIIERAVIHRLIYFEMQKAKMSIEPHVAYFYGPFNRQVAHGLEILVHLNILSERRLGNNSYEYAITDRNISRIKLLAEDGGKTYKTIEKIVQTCRECCDLRPDALSFAAKTHHTLSRRGRKKGITRNEAVGMAGRLGWKIAEADVGAGADLLQRLGLAKINR